MHGEVHGIVVWPQAQHVLDGVLDNVAERFELLDVCRLQWTPSLWDRNLLRFYGYDVRVRDKRALDTTAAPVLVVLRDPSPLYGVRTRSRLPGLVDLAVHDAKQRYRELAGAPFGIHGSVDAAEADRDLFLLLGRRSASYADAPPVVAQPRDVPGDLTGAGGWPDAAPMLTALGLTASSVVLWQDHDNGRQRWTLLTADAAWAGLVAGGRRPVVGGQPCELDLVDKDSGRLSSGWQEVLLHDATSGPQGVVPHVSPLHSFHARLRLAGADDHHDGAARLAAMARDVGAPDGDYGNPLFAAAVHNDFLRRHGWLVKPPLGRRTRLRAAAASRLRARARR